MFGFPSYSYALGLSSDCWLAHMDRFLTGGIDQDETESIAKNMIKLVDIYYSALDGHKVNYNLML
jgi:RNA-dependent RNA polymerase